MNKNELLDLIERLESTAVASGVRMLRHTLDCGCDDIDVCPSEIARLYRMSVLQRDEIRAEIEKSA